MGKGNKLTLLRLDEQAGLYFDKAECSDLYSAIPKEVCAWENHLSQQCQDERTGEQIQVVTNRSKMPLTIFPNSSALANSSMNTIAALKEDEAMSFLSYKEANNSRFKWLVLLAALLGVIVALIVLLNVG